MGESSGTWSLKTRQMTNLKNFLRFPGPQPRKPQKRHDLETYVSFPGNLLKRTFMYIFSITKIVSRFPNSRFPGYYPGRKPGDLQKCPETIWSSWWHGLRGNTRAIHASCCATASWLWAEWTVEELELGSLTRCLSHGGRTSSNHLTFITVYMFTCKIKELGGFFTHLRSVLLSIYHLPLICQWSWCQWLKMMTRIIILILLLMLTQFSHWVVILCRLTGIQLHTRPLQILMSVIFLPNLKWVLPISNNNTWSCWSASAEPPSIKSINEIHTPRCCRSHGNVSGDTNAADSRRFHIAWADR